MRSACFYPLWMALTPRDEQNWRTLGPCDTLQEIKQEAEERQQKTKKDLSPSRWWHTEIFISAWNGVQSSLLLASCTTWCRKAQAHMPWQRDCQFTLNIVNWQLQLTYICVISQNWVGERLLLLRVCVGVCLCVCAWVNRKGTNLCNTPTVNRWFYYGFIRRQKSSSPHLRITVLSPLSQNIHTEHVLV